MIGRLSDKTESFAEIYSKPSINSDMDCISLSALGRFFALSIALATTYNGMIIISEWLSVNHTHTSYPEISYLQAAVEKPINKSVLLHPRMPKLRAVKHFNPLLKSVLSKKPSNTISVCPAIRPCHPKMKVSISVCSQLRAC